MTRKAMNKRIKHSDDVAAAPEARPRKIGYARVSMESQRLDAQIDALRAAGCDQIFSDHGVSGMKLRRPEFDTAMATLRPGDTLVVWKLDRMSRSLRHLVDIIEELRVRGAHFECITDAIDTSTAMGQFTFYIMAAMAQLERSLISERTIAGLAAARARGQRLGRPKKASRRNLVRESKWRRSEALRRAFVRVAMAASDDRI